MSRHVKSSAWQAEISNAYRMGPAQARDLMQKLSRGEIIITNEAGTPIDLSMPPTTCRVAPLPPIAVRDRHGRIIAEAAPFPVQAEQQEQRVSQSFSLDDRVTFEASIAHEAETVKTSLRMHFDQLRKERSIN